MKRKFEERSGRVGKKRGGAKRKKKRKARCRCPMFFGYFFAYAMPAFGDVRMPLIFSEF
jgi:hypothetical protein